MIYTVTFNPSLDYVVQADQLIPGEINRTTSEHIYPGGKGNNVSVILSNLGLKSKALGFKAGFTGDVLEKMLEESGCEDRCIGACKLTGTFYRKRWSSQDSGNRSRICTGRTQHNCI